MLDQVQRAAVENIKRARRIKITIDEGTDHEQGFYLNSTPRLSHDIAISLQTHFNEQNNWKSNERI